jgi:hypothetical protein
VEVRAIYPRAGEHVERERGSPPGKRCTVWGWDDCALRLAAETRQQAHVEEAVAVPLLVTAAIADRDQAAHDNAHGEALYHSAEQRLELVGELEHVADTETVEARVVAALRDRRSVGDQRGP